MIKSHHTFSEQGEGLFICNGLCILDIILDANLNNLINMFVCKKIQIFYHFLIISLPTLKLPKLFSLQQNYGAKCIPVRDRGFLVQVGCHVLPIFETPLSMS